MAAFDPSSGRAAVVSHASRQRAATVVSHASLQRAATFAQLGWTAVASVHLVGFSMGGMITQELACADPERAPNTNTRCNMLPHGATAQRSAAQRSAAQVLVSQHSAAARADARERARASSHARLQRPQRCSGGSVLQHPRSLQRPRSVATDAQCCNNVPAGFASVCLCSTWSRGATVPPLQGAAG
jgi:pimeloyl-ACP methyl ester carboxylesterase